MKKRNKWLSGVLASSLVLSQIVTTIPMSVIAAPERAVADGVQQERAVVEMWRQFKSSTKNDNGNNAAILVNTNKGTEGMEAGEISFVLKPNGDQATTRFNVGPWITDNGHYMTIGTMQRGGSMNTRVQEIVILESVNSRHRQLPEKRWQSQSNGIREITL